MMKNMHIVVASLMLVVFIHNQRMVNGDDEAGRPLTPRTDYEEDYYYDDYDYRYCPDDSCPNDYFCDYYEGRWGYCSRCPNNCDDIYWLWGQGIDECVDECERRNNANGCFSGNMEVVVQGKGTVSMDALQVGDFVKTGNGEGFEQVYAFGHRDAHTYAKFLQLHTSAGTPLEMTGEHLVYVAGKASPVRADSIQVGDRLQANDNVAVVEKIVSVARNGLYNPMTSSGTIQVNGITASNYISFQKQNNEHVEFEGSIVAPLSHHDFAHRAVTPFRFYCTALAICDTNDGNNGMPAYVSNGIELIAWSQQQHIAVQMSIWATYRMLLLASILMTFAIFLFPAYLLCDTSIFQMQNVVSQMKIKKDN